MDSFYGGRQGTPFVIKKTYSSIAEMKKNIEADLWYGEYCLISTESKLNPENGEIYQRTYDGNVFIGNIVGPSGGLPSFNVVESLSDVQDKSDNLETGSYDSYSAIGQIEEEEEYLTSPGSVLKTYKSKMDAGMHDGKDDPSLHFKWFNVARPRKDSEDMQTVYECCIGFDFPVTNFTAAKTITLKSTEKASVSIEKGNDNFFDKQLTFSIPRGVSISNVEINDSEGTLTITLDNNKTLDPISFVYVKGVSLGDNKHTFYSTLSNSEEINIGDIDYPKEMAMTEDGVVSYSTTLGTNKKNIGSLNFIKDVLVPNDDSSPYSNHLLVLFSDWYMTELAENTGIDLVEYNGTTYVDYGSVLTIVDGGIYELINENYDTIDSALVDLNTNYATKEYTESGKIYAINVKEITYLAIYDQAKNTWVSLGSAGVDLSEVSVSQIGSDGTSWSFSNKQVQEGALRLERLMLPADKISLDTPWTDTTVFAAETWNFTYMNGSTSEKEVYVG